MKSINKERSDRLIVREFFDEKYNIELVNFLVKNVVEKDEIIKTIDYIYGIKFTHDNLSSSEYIVHPLRVAKIIYQINNNIDINTLNIALLHNIFEVSEVENKDFLLRYDSEIMISLRRLKVDRLLEKDIQYKKEYYDEIYKDKKSAIVKAIDKLDNLFLLCLNNNEDVRTWYLDEVEEFIYPIIEKYIPRMLEYYKELVKDCRKLGFLDKEKVIELCNKNYL